MSQPDLFRVPHRPWNAGRMTGAKALLKPKQIWVIRQHLKSVGSIRDPAMCNIALDAKLRGCDLVKRRLGDVAQGGVIRQRSTVIQRPVVRSRWRSPKRLGTPWPNGRNAADAAVINGCFLAGVRMERTSVLASMLAGSMPGENDLPQPSAYGTHSQ